MVSNGPLRLDIRDVSTAVMEYISDLLVVLSPDGCICEASPSVYRNLGVTGHGLIGTPLREHIHPEDVVQFERLLTDVRNAPASGVRHAKWRCLHEESGPLFLAVDVIPKADGAGELQWVLLCARNITQERRIQAQIHRSEQVYKSLFEYNADAVFALDLEGRFVEVNKACERVSGYAVEALQGTAFYPLIAPVELAVVNQNFVRACRGEPSNHDVTIIHRSGERVVLNVTSLPITVDGQVVGIYGIAKDITSIRHKEKLLLVQKSVSESIAAGDDVEHVLQQITECAGELFEDCIPCIMLVSERGDALLPAACSDKLSMQYIGALDAVPINPNAGSYGAAAYNNKPVVVTDIEVDPLWQNYRSLARAEGLRACFAVPILSDDHQVVGTFGVYYKTRKQPTGEVMEALKTFSHLAGLAIVRHQHAAKLHALANTDPLTGLPNRRYFMDRLRSAVQAGEQVGLIFLDLDRFKWINDTLGHTFGDKVLVEYVRRVSSCLDTRALFSRLGGDEFAVIVPDVTTEQDVMAVAERVLRLSDKLVHIDGHNLRVTSSIGTYLSPDAECDVEALLSNVDTALYTAKNSGRNNIKRFDPNMKFVTYDRLVMESDIQSAIDQEQFYMVYQPKFHAADGRITGVEALIRWNHPREMLISPGDFIPVAEQAGLISSVDEWVLREVCRQIQVWARHGLEIPVSVNISQIHFQQFDFGDRLRRTIEQYGVKAGLIDIEITETALMQHATEAHVFAKLQELGDIGVTVSIDDFGIGHSSLNLLRKFPVDFLKIDQSFVQDHQKPDIVTAIIQLGHSLCMRVVAEGVESQVELDFLTAQGCDEIQGYLLARPMAPEDIVRTYA
ncbi:EAL domain-containing protein [Alicyclobacillus fastidiosus]|uniref:EAL domain-containing protein n=1 Tax=Alicyclobacillus fastidiosus TaxID=392011 RepID=A0ABY6ZJJ2_9BACL|nr:bifunctional diguanylate cyclase/phosphodiesterase [Alicyclobacillus fastidiosus]WAH43006.1 EAL domain-containing protein [Alicyclobacillus fastidiosus]GMA64976.1 bifunctional diguanylate cyclase/phosphodiesterase [Alicyclobacillus fastidiosus]